VPVTVNLSISEEERALLTELLDSDYRDLKEEIGDTDTPDFKDDLKAREQLLLRLLDKVRSPSQTA
jgi:hypothetical protein